MTISYGFNSVRFLQPVRAGKQVRGVFTLQGLQRRNPGQWQSTFAVNVEVESEDKPALVAEWMILTIVPEPSGAGRFSSG